MSKLLTNIFSSISSEQILGMVTSAKIPVEKSDKISFDFGELFISAVAGRNKTKKDQVDFFKDMGQGKEEKVDIFFGKNKAKVIKVLARENNESKEKIGYFLSMLTDEVSKSFMDILKKTNMDEDIFFQVIKMSEDSQKKESIEKNGILSIIDLNKKSTVIDNIFCFFKKR